MKYEKPSLEETYKSECIDDKYVCPMCLESYLTKPFIDEDGEHTEYYTKNLILKGDCVRICYNCFHYSC